MRKLSHCAESAGRPRESGTTQAQARWQRARNHSGIETVRACLVNPVRLPGQAYADTNGLPPARNLTRETAPASSAKKVATAESRMERAIIPDEFHGDFREWEPPKLRLETAIMEARAFMLLMSDPAEEFCGSRGEAIQAGIASLSLRLGDELAAAFYAGEDAE